jgi:putative tricarboxylic transport membrane protein
MSVERILTGAIVVFGLVFLFLVIPEQVETVDFGRIVPSTVPSLALVILTVAAAVQIFTSKFSVDVNLLVCIRAAIFIALMGLSVWLMERFGFEYIAPVLALAVMLLIGERRWYWLLLGGVVIPLGVWLIVERLLDRPLA